MVGNKRKWGNNMFHNGHNDDGRVVIKLMRMVKYSVRRTFIAKLIKRTINERYFRGIKWFDGISILISRSPFSLSNSID